MNKLFFILILSFVACFTSCKKKEQVIGELIEPVSSKYLNSNYIDGIIRNYWSISETASGISTWRTCNAYFNRVPSDNAKEKIRAGRLFHNNDSIPFYSSESEYGAVPVGTDDNWSLTGNDLFPAFSSQGIARPSFTLLNNLPDNISKSTGFVFAVNDVSNITGASVTIRPGYDPANPHLQPYISFNYTVLPGNNSFTVTPDQISEFPLGNGINLQITLTKTLDIFVGQKVPGQKKIRFFNYVQWSMPTIALKP